jgi:hypothetical protein
MPDTVSVVSAAAATLAAILTAINLYASGRWERNRWARDALVDAFLGVLDASFAGGRAAKLVLDGASTDDGELLAQMDHSHWEQINIITKLRLLTAPRVVDAVMALHLADHAVSDLARAVPLDTDQREIQLRKDGVWLARQEFIAAAKAEIGLPARLPATSRH